MMSFVGLRNTLTIISSEINSNSIIFLLILGLCYTCLTFLLSLMCLLDSFLHFSSFLHPVLQFGYLILTNVASNLISNPFIEFLILDFFFLVLGF